MTRGKSKYAQFFTDDLSIHTVSTFKGSKKCSFCLSLLIFLQKRAEKLKRTGLLNKVITGGPLFSSHPV